MCVFVAVLMYRTAATNDWSQSAWDGGKCCHWVQNCCLDC